MGNYGSQPHKYINYHNHLRKFYKFKNYMNESRIFPKWSKKPYMNMIFLRNIHHSIFAIHNVENYTISFQFLDCSWEYSSLNKHIRLLALEKLTCWVIFSLIFYQLSSHSTLPKESQSCNNLDFLAEPKFVLSWYPKMDRATRIKEEIITKIALLRRESRASGFGFNMVKKTQVFYFVSFESCFNGLMDI